MKKKYRFYKIWVPILKTLPTNEDRLDVINAISDLLLDGRDTGFNDPIVQSAWERIKQTKEFGKEIAK